MPVWGRFAEKLYAGSWWEDFPNSGITPNYKDNSEWHFSNTDDSLNSGYYNYNWWYEEEEEELPEEEVVEEEVLPEEEVGYEEE